MIVDARTLAAGETVGADVAVVGAGPAGIVVALELARAGLRTALLERGGLEADAASQDFCDGEVNGPYPHLASQRVCGLGGSTAHWEGYCRPFDALDFEDRPWIPLSGWPFRRDVLVPFYRRAEALCQVGPFDYGDGMWDGGGLGPLLPFDPDHVRTALYRRSPPTRFGEVYRPDLELADGLTVFVRAHVLRLETTDDAGRVTALTLATAADRTLRVQARLFVLAGGGIENARLLLLSNQVGPAGLGNGHDLVGRYFADHVLAASGSLWPIAGDFPLQAYDAEKSSFGVLSLPAAVVGRERIGNLTIFLRSYAMPQQGRSDGRGHTIRAVASQIERAGPSTQPTRFLGFHNRVEPVPNSDNRVVLADERDRFGQPRARLVWRPGAEEPRFAQRAHILIGQEAGRTGFGRVLLQLQGDAPGWSPDTWMVSGHHMGTTRMHEDPRSGVVDGDGRVHGIVNLYVTGSSVFPTYGCSNPTLTLVALSLRLADHIKSAGVRR